VVGTPTAHDAAALAAVNAHARVGLIFPLGKGRAAASGQFREASAAALENAQTTVLLGDTIVLAPTFSVLEQAMWGINTVIAREAFSLARKSGVNLQLLYSALREGAAGSR
jgi:3-hydroxyisobutyrate dehydrogenase-like beta-hydroxyacid dehydrogenase